MPCDVCMATTGCCCLLWARPDNDREPGWAAPPVQPSVTTMANAFLSEDPSPPTLYVNLVAPLHRHKFFLDAYRSFAITFQTLGQGRDWSIVAPVRGPSASALANPSLLPRQSGARTTMLPVIPARHLHITMSHTESTISEMSQPIDHENGSACPTVSFACVLHPSTSDPTTLRTCLARPPARLCLSAAY